MVAQHYRWDFVGLSTDERPTPATSEKVVDGSTYYCSDTSKLYVWCKNSWYERKALGDGGGGTTYTAGDGIDITDSTISVDTDTIQPKLTAGENITITDNVISASGGVKTLTTADYDWPTNSPSMVALWKLPVGQYIVDFNTDILPARDVSSVGGSSSTKGGVVVITSNSGASGDYTQSTFIYTDNYDKKIFCVDNNGYKVSGFPHDL